MKKYQGTLEKILENNSLLDSKTIKRILIIYLGKDVFIGDCSIRIDKLMFFKSFFCNPIIDFNVLQKSVSSVVEGLLKNSPYVNSISNLELSDIDFEVYDIVFCVDYKEEEMLLEFLDEKYGDKISSDQFRLAVFTIKHQMRLIPESDFIFPVNKSLTNYIGNQPGNIYLTEQERKWGNHFLKMNGLKENESLFIVLDSTSRKNKLLNIDVYFDYLKFILKIENIKVLNFDESRLGKWEFYRAWLGAENFGKIIFSKGLTLRQALCIIGSDHTRLIFGPCTGLIHCASGIYNYFLRNGMSSEQVPHMITYTGRYSPGEKAYDWWGNYPLVNCLLLKEKENKREIVVLNDLSEEEKHSEETLPCSEYTAKMLIDYTAELLRLHSAQPVAKSIKR
jgi:hypothetical protein